MSTIKLYQQDVYLTECTATVESALEDKITLDQTIFFPTGGGQSCDLGYISGKKVVEVYEDQGVVYHRLDQAQVLAPGDRVSCQIDWDRRFDNMQRHCGEHILSGMFFQEFGGVNRGFHMGDEYMTVDISLDANPAFTEITWAMAMKAELCANEAVWAGAPVTVMRFDDRKEAEKLPLRKALAIDEEISIVCVGNIENASDCVACCGTHPSNAGQVGLIKLYKVENYKGMFRIYFEAGKRALLDYDKKHDLVRMLRDKYSAGTGDLLDKVKTHEEKNKAVRNDLYVLKNSVIKERIEQIRPLIKEDAIVSVQYDDMKVDDLLSIGRPLTSEIKKLLFIVAVTDNTLLLFSDGHVDCGRLVKENASIYNGKGGGNATSARAIFSNRDYLNTFMDLVEKHLR